MKWVLVILALCADIKVLADAPAGEFPSKRASDESHASALRSTEIFADVHLLQYLESGADLGRLMTDSYGPLTPEKLEMAKNGFMQVVRHPKFSRFLAPKLLSTMKDTGMSIEASPEFIQKQFVILRSTGLGTLTDDQLDEFAYNAVRFAESVVDPRCVPFLEKRLRQGHSGAHSLYRGPASATEFQRIVDIYTEAAQGELEGKPKLTVSLQAKQAAKAAYGLYLMRLMESEGRGEPGNRFKDIGEQLGSEATAGDALCDMLDLSLRTTLMLPRAARLTYLRVTVAPEDSATQKENAGATRAEPQQQVR